MMNGKITTLEMECALATFLNYRVNLIVPNISWGFGIHENDLLVVSKFGYLTEIEIKVTRADLRADAKKSHCHRSHRIKRLFFALPDYLEHCIEFVPERADIILVKPMQKKDIDAGWSPRCRTIREPEINKIAPKISDRDRYKIARLGALRIWRLKRKIITERK